jgi:amino acid transporter
MSQTVDAKESSGEVQTELKRVMGPKLLLLFIVGDILGTGVYALTGDVAAEVGGAAWAPFLAAFAIALVTAFSYLELVTKYPQAAGAALYTHKAFGLHFLTFMVCFTVMCSGITSASTASKAFASNMAKGFGWDADNTNLVLLIALGFMALVAAINFRGVGESVKANIVLTCIELSGLLLVIMVGFSAIFAGKTDFSRTMVFDSPSDKSAFLAVTAATSLAFFAMVGFEDSVNMAEETHEPAKNFPRMMIAGIGITGVIYILVALFAVAIVPVGELGSSDTPLVTVVEKAAPGIPIDVLLPFISMFAVANSARDCSMAWPARRCCRRCWVGCTRVGRPRGSRSSSRPSSPSA